MKRILAAIALVVLGACSSPSPAAEEIAITMRDNTYSPKTIEVQAGDEVEFTFVNRGKNTHDAFIGDSEAQDEHEETMKEDDGHAHHGDGGAVTVAPGKRATLRHTFDETGTTYIGCHQVGHWDDGMRIRVSVV